MVNPSHHSWLLAMDGFTTIRSYSPEAERAIRDAAAAAGRDLLNGTALPYDLFFDAMPLERREFLASLDRYCQTPECVCSHAGVHPTIANLARQGKLLTWGHRDFPEEYAGEAHVMYGHHNDPDLDAGGWPRPRIVGRAIGLDTISFRVLTAVALPGPRVLAEHAVPPGDSRAGLSRRGRPENRSCDVRLRRCR